MSEIKLLSCPFCGGEARVNTNKTTQGQTVLISCTNCNCKNHLYARACYKGDIEKEAIGIWNSRKPMEQIVEQLEELRQKEYDDSDEEPDLTDVDDIYDDGRSQGRYEALREAIGIVKGSAG